MYEIFKELYEKINLITKVIFLIASTRHRPEKNENHCHWEVLVQASPPPAPTYLTEDIMGTQWLYQTFLLLHGAFILSKCFLN